MGKELVKRSFFGIFIGAFGTIITMGLIIYLGNIKTIDGPIFMQNAIAVMIIGGVISAAPLLFQIRKLNLFQQSILHFTLISIVFYSVSLTVGWLPFRTSAILHSVIVCVVLYVLSWTGFYLYFRYVARQLTKKLQNCE